MSLGWDIFSNCMRCRLTGVGSYNIEATSMGAAWLLTSELVARLDGRMGELQYSFSGELPLQEYFSIISRLRCSFPSLFRCSHQTCTFTQLLTYKQDLFLQFRSTVQHLQLRHYNGSVTNICAVVELSPSTAS
jgi:hypothetical protein